jgi:hypothetical protein
LTPEALPPDGKPRRGCDSFPSAGKIVPEETPFYKRVTNFVVDFTNIIIRRFGIKKFSDLFFKFYIELWTESHTKNV